MTITVEPVSVEDTNAIHQQIPEFDRDDYVARHYDDRCPGNDPLVLGATRDGTEAGYIIGYDRHHDGSYYCWMAGVIPDHRGNGVMTAMMDELVAYAADNDYQSVTVKTQEQFDPMINFLDGYGFDTTTREPEQTDDEEIWYELAI